MLELELEAAAEENIHSQFHIFVQWQQQKLLISSMTISQNNISAFQIHLFNISLFA